MDAFLGNPPFAGKNGLIEAGGPSYLPWLQAVHPGAHGNADLSAHFLRRCDCLLGKHGTMGFLTTGSIAHGDTRSTGLGWMVRHGLVIYAATTRLPWIGGPNVAICLFHLAKGRLAECTDRAWLDGVRVGSIDSQLRPATERADPLPLAANANTSFQGSIVLGTGFILTSDERDALIAKSARNVERIFPYLGGEEVNTSSSQAFDRYVISFGNMALAEAERWPDLVRIVDERVKSERDSQRDKAGKNTWWLHLRPRSELYASIAPLDRCLVTSIHTKHLVFSFQPVERVFSHALYVFPLSARSPFAILQSRTHEAWARLRGSTLEDRAATARLRYSGSDCFDTFPFPQRDPRTVIPALETIGDQLYTARARYMVDENVGLTITYNRLKDPANTEPRVLELRRLHEAMDRAVLDAYGWSDVDVPPYCPLDDDGRKKLERFEDEVIDRLFVLNAKRAEEERIKGLAVGAKQKGKAKKAAPKVAEAQAALFEAPPTKAEDSGES
jgi:hypothetical protein